MTVRPVVSVLQWPERDFIYDALASGPDLELCVDVGAAAGDVTLKLAHIARRVVAFEPFSNNFAYFEQATRSVSNVELVRKAVSDRIGRSSFYVGSTVSGVEPGWEDRAGYSSVGFLMTPRKAIVSRLRRLVFRGQSRPEAHVVRVLTTTLDAEFPTDTIDFLKIDTQGAEARVLRGASTLLAERRISVVYAEWGGDPEVEAILTRCGFALFDSTYVGSGDADYLARLEHSGFEVIDEVPLSTGKSAVELVYRGSEPAGQVLARLNDGRGWVQTDLIAVAADRAGEFIEQLARQS